MKREREAAQHFDVGALSVDADLIRQIQKSRDDRQVGCIFDQQAGIDYLRMKVEEFERGQSL